MFLCTNLFTVLIPLWGMVGLWSERIGYHHRVSRSEFSRTSFLLTYSTVGILLLQCHLRSIPGALLRGMPFGTISSWMRFLAPDK